MTVYNFYMLPTIKHYDDTDTIVTTVNGDFDPHFMLFDKTMNKFIFHGLTV